ncbi:MAG TPA: response regulator transcription factor [Chthoniobacteraceae bacterium]|jgi:DNA-binding response OmpR family regulator|nr:response regulator transcription factor [Chthoniobacteraceae bacterium]
METILLIEDDPAMLRGLADNFKAGSFHVLTATDGERGLEEALRARPDLIVLDIMLPKINGYEICRLLRAEQIDTPIIMLTARNQESDILLGLNLGADDFVTKPFSIKELLARAEAFLRRRRTVEPQSYVFGDCQLDIPAHTFRRSGREVKLSPREFELLHYFLRKPGCALTRERILNSVWGYDRMVTPRSIDRFVVMLRQKIEPDPQRPTYLQTIREFGYKFVPEPAMALR